MLHQETDKKLKQDIVCIDEKRKVLEQIVEITRAIEYMQDSLNAVLILGEPSSDLPPEAANLYKSLNESLLIQSTNKIKVYLDNLERLINKQLEQILHYSGFDFDSDEAIEILTLSGDSVNTENSPIDMLNDFKRTAQTAVSLRVLLKKRGICTDGAFIAVPKEVIKKQYSLLEEQEKQQRRKVKEKVIDMKQNIKSMIDNPGYPDSMKTMLSSVLDNLENDLKQIDSGISLDQLSFVADAYELSDVPVAEEETRTEAPQQTKEQKKKAGLADKASRWLNSPWKVSWDNLED